ncbi:MAG: GNAT family N-acetyltransferase [Chlorobi bacterium]|nr:GNAT family N-acetyltransferase [Chlorobiota bacterium]
MKTIISPVDRGLLEKELTKDIFIRETNNGNNQIYVFTDKQAPNLMREVGRLREYTFREAGGGTGKEMDIDVYDTAEVPFKQLIVWNPREKEIVGGYRYIYGKDVPVDKNGQPKSPTSKLFHFSEKFLKKYWPYTFELGRSFVQPLFQPTVNLRKGMYSLDNLWDGLGAISVMNPETKYNFGKITMYPDFDTFARDMILYFMNKYFPDTENLLKPYEPLKLTTRQKVLDSIFTGVNYDEDYRILAQKVRRLKESIPPLVNAYMNLSGSMKTFGTAVNPAFGNVEETAIIITIADIYDYKKDRHMGSFDQGN